jgi:hypothetical protein
VLHDGSACWEIPDLANEASAKDEHGHEYGVLLFACARGVHEVEIVPPGDDAHAFLPGVEHLEWIDKA